MVGGGDDDRDKVEKHFLRRAKEGVLLTLRQLVAYVKKRGLQCSRAFLEGIRQTWLATAAYRRAPSLRPKVFQTYGIPDLGVAQADLAFYFEEHK